MRNHRRRVVLACVGTIVTLAACGAAEDDRVSTLGISEMNGAFVAAFTPDTLTGALAGGARL
jgi:hypothetical protein